MERKQKIFETFKKDMEEITNRLNKKYKEKHGIDIKVAPQFLNKDGLVYIKFGSPEQKSNRRFKSPEEK